MKPGSTMRVARPTITWPRSPRCMRRALASTCSLSLKITRFDGVILGHPKQPYHIEFTSQRGHKVGKAPTRDHCLVFYVPDKNDWEAGCAQMISAGFREMPSYNPYWDLQGRTFEDIDGYRVVLQNAAWTE